MPVRINSQFNTLMLNANIDNYTILDDSISVKRGDALHFVYNGENAYVTNRFGVGDTVDAIALHSTNSTTKPIPCYLLNKFSNKCIDISRVTCSELSLITCDQINIVGVRTNQVNLR